MRPRRKQRCACAAAGFLALILPALFAFSVLAEEKIPEESAHAYVSIVNASGAPALSCWEVPLRDTDGDGLLTVHDALLETHDMWFDGGAEAGYAAEHTENGRIATMLWGEENGCIEIYVNHAPVDDLLTTVQDGDLLYGVVCEDTKDALYCHFDVSFASVRGGKPLVLTLTAAGIDGETPVTDAVIRIDGKDTAFRTDAEGTVTLQFDGSGSCIVSAWKDGVALHPPVCVVSVGEEEPFAGDLSVLLRWGLLSVGALAGIVLALRWRIRRTDPL